MRPGWKGTVTSCPPSLAAFSTAAPPASTIRSARETFFPSLAEALNSFWMPSRVPSTLASWSGSFTAQNRWGARRTRAPLAPPRLSLPRNVLALAQAALTSSLTPRPEASTLALRAAMSVASISL